VAPGDSAQAEALNGSEEEAEAAPLGSLEQYADAAGAGQISPLPHHRHAFRTLVS